LASRQVGSAIDCTPTLMTRFVFFQASTTACASSIVRVIGFSQYTSLPAFIASMAMRACQWSGVAIVQMSTSFCSRTWR
jgi:hypothetical protein